MSYLPAYRLKLYRNFKALEVNDFYGIVRYYERFEDAIRTLDFDEYFDCTLAYANALFETGNYGKHIVMSDHLLELLILHNIETWGGEDWYAKTLFRKAASLYQLQQYPKAEHILRELLKLNPSDRMTLRFLISCLLRQRPSWLHRLRAAAILLTLCAALIVALELFVVKPFFPDWYQLVLILHNVLLFGGIGMLFAGESLHWIRCQGRAVRFAKRMRQRRHPL